MIDYPQTLTEARKTSYGWNLEKRPYNEDFCAAEVADRSNSRWTHFSQCSSPKGHGPCGLYCKRHAPKAEAQSKEVKTKTWYRLDHTDRQLEKIEVVSHTAKMLTLKGGRTERITEKTFLTLDDGMRYLLERAESRVRSAEVSLRQETLNLENLRKLKATGKYPISPK